MTSKRRKGYWSPVQPEKIKDWDAEVAKNPKNGRPFNRQFQGAICSVFNYFEERKNLINNPNLKRRFDVR